MSEKKADYGERLTSLRSTLFYGDVFNVKRGC